MHYNTKRYHKRMAIMHDYLGGRCVICGTQLSLEIHHKNPNEKEFDIAKHFSKPWEELGEELDKCELRCQTHHKEAHTAKHGLSMYSHHGCRCDICREVWSEACKKYKLKAKLKKLAA